MSENKHTPEPWRISDDNKSTIICFQGEQTPHGTTPYFASGGLLESERTANARRVVACVNRLAQFTTEQIEDFGYDLFAEDRPRLVEAQNEIYLIKKQRDELLEVLLTAAETFASYAEIHAAKTPPDIVKAEFNRDRAQMCFAAIANMKGEQ